MTAEAVYLEREPLLGMLMSAVEVYNRECFGYIFGRKPNRRREHFVITSAFNCAGISRRTNLEVRQSQRACDRLHNIQTSAPGLFPYIGYFHSHAAAGRHRAKSDPSVFDRKTIARDDGDFGVIITIARRGSRLLDWRLKSKRTRLRGSLGTFDCHVIAFTPVRSEQGEILKDVDDAPLIRRMELVVARSTLRALNRARRR